MNRIITTAAFAAVCLTSFADKATDLIKGHEGYRASVYRCQAGVKAIGYGFTDEHLIRKGRMTREEADSVLQGKCIGIRRMIRRDFKGLTANEEAALVSFVYNVGWGRFKTSSMYRHLVRGSRGRIIGNEFRKWVYVTKGGKRVKSRGIQKRREAEATLFEKG